MITYTKTALSDEPIPLIQDDRCVGWAHGAFHAVRAIAFLKSAIAPRSLWLEWDEITQPVGVWRFDRYRTVREMEPSLSELCRGTTGWGGEE
jgi:hypothetical protein